MKSTCLWLAGALLGLASFPGCGGSETGGGAAAGANNAGTASGSAGKSGNQGGSASSGGASNNAGGSGSVGCSADDCGPQLGLPNFTCEDGSMGGPTGRCLQAGDECAWEVRDCPPAGEGGAGGQGGEGNAGGAASDPCGGCEGPEEICILQVGGPGVSRFTCATQSPCGAAGACACIQGQGACGMNLAEDGYCHCDNGLD